MAATPSATLLDLAKCYMCLGISLADALKLALLDTISQSGGSSGSGVPSGVILMWSGTIATIPSGWVLCNGAAGTPDLRNRFVVAADADSGGSAKTTLTGAATQSGGSISHTHGITDPGHTHGEGGGALWNNDNPASDAASAVTGITVNSQSAPQPYYALAYIMKT